MLGKKLFAFLPILNDRNFQFTQAKAFDGMFLGLCSLLAGNVSGTKTYIVIIAIEQNNTETKFGNINGYGSNMD